MDRVIISNEPQTMTNLADTVVIPINFTVHHNDSLTVNLTLIDDTGHTLEFTLIENIIIGMIIMACISLKHFLYKQICMLKPQC